MKWIQSLFLILFVTAFCSCRQHTTLFEKVSSGHSGVTFVNEIRENDSINPFDVVNIYNGGGVGIGDFNNDGLQDIYLTGNLVSSKMYLNKGDFKFDDITAKADVGGMGRWARGVSVVDINNDGLQDIYVCNTIWQDSLRRRNILYINQGIDKDGVPHFKDMAADYGLDVHVQSTMGYFFDYDNDGDLDMYLVVNEGSNGSNASVFRERNSNTMHSQGRMFRNDMDSTQHHGVFHDVSVSAGTTIAGYGHSANICDMNRDGWKDIYIANDFLSSNILYINNHDGTFTDRSREYFKHTSFNAMGQDVQDINNDGLADVFELDMSPPDNFRKKMMLNASNYNTFQNFTLFGYQFQYVRNTLQINQGPRVLEGDSLGAPVFADLGFMAGVAETDWSWTPLLTDFDNDGLRDIIVTNGFPRDVSDHDFIAYRDERTVLLPKRELLKKIPEIKIPNFAFHNDDGLHFSDVSKQWGVDMPTFSNGAAYADFDNDGDLDMIVNNINDQAGLYRNTLRDDAESDSTHHFLDVRLKGPATNVNGFGSFISIFYDGGKQQFSEATPYRGYLSTMQLGVHFGLGKNASIDSLVVTWPDGRKQSLPGVKTNAAVIVDYKNSGNGNADLQTLLASDALFREVTRSMGINYKHDDYDFIDFNIQTTLPHKLSEYCPATAAGDVNGDGLDDLVIGGNANHKAQVFLQQKNGKFLQRDLWVAQDTSGIDYKDGGILLADINGDGYPDVYATSAGFRYPSNSINYQDRLFLNDGKGNFTLTTDVLPSNHASKLCVRGFDYNHDGKLDLFVSGRVDPGHYPKPVSSFIYRNDSENGRVRLTDVTREVAPDLVNIGLVCDALFSDFDGDGESDLILAGEWMPVKFLKYQQDKFIDVTSSTGVQQQSGWWNSIAAGDFRHTGRTDYIVGNTGLNSFYRASDQYPIRVIAKDFGNDGGYEAIPSVYLPDQKGELREFPANMRDEIIEKMPYLKKKFSNYHSFAISTMDEVLTAKQRDSALKLSANNLQSCFLRNDGNGKFTVIPLPLMAQVSVINGMLVDDFDGDGNADVLMSGNDYGTEVRVGRYDAFNGLLMKGDGEGNFLPLPMRNSGINIPGNGKGVARLVSADGKYLVACSQNRDALKLFSLNHQVEMMLLEPGDVSALITLKDGRKTRQEFYYGASFLSQSTRKLMITPQVKTIEITNSKGAKRTLQR
jgi:ASPIC and UnbV/FG-GAP-like repeat